MLWVCFVFSIAFSLSWLGYQGLYIHQQLAGTDFTALESAQMAVYVGLLVVPVWLVWQIFGLLLQMSHTKKTDEHLTELLAQSRKNQDYTDLIVRVMIEAEHEIKDGFVVNKFDVFISDLNELLADIVVRSNAVSSLQLEQLWARVKNGERWVIGKALVEASKRQTDFASYLVEKAKKDSVFKGTLMEFCTRYQDLCELLEKHDRDRVFLNMIETGVLGSIYTLLAPAADSNTLIQNADLSAQREDADENGEDTPVLAAPFADMPAPEYSKSSPSSFWSRLNPFTKEDEDTLPDAESVAEEDDRVFFETLHKNLDESTPTANPEPMYKEPVFDITPPSTEALDLSPVVEDEPDQDGKDSYMPAPKLTDEEEPLLSISDEKKSEPEKNNENFAYPFGGWIDEKNYK